MAILLLIISLIDEEIFKIYDSVYFRQLGNILLAYMNLSERQFLKEGQLEANKSKLSLIKLNKLVSLLFSVFSGYIITIRFVHKWRHGLRRGGGQEFCDDSTKTLVIKRVPMVGRGLFNFVLRPIRQSHNMSLEKYSVVPKCLDSALV